MNSAVSQRPTRPFLPEITPNRNKRRKSTHHRMKESPPAGLGSDNSPQIVSKADISKFRNSLKQNTCVELLQEGFHRSFSELFFLLKRDQDRRESAEPGTALSLQTPLEEQRDKVETLRRYLSWAEEAERTSSWTVVCEHRLSLGEYFSSPEDLWLSLHFYHSCADKEYGGRSRPASEARARLAELYLQTGDLERAQQQAELCIQQAVDGGFLDSDGQSLKLRGCKVLWRIYSGMADSLVDAEEYNEALTLLHRGFNTAAACEDKKVEAEAAFQLGLTNQRAGDHNNAKQFFNTCMQIYGTLEDAAGLGKSYMAMAKSLESEENIDETVQCLEKLADISRSGGLLNQLVEAYLSLGSIYYKRSQYSRACEFFLQGNEVACELGDVPLLEKAQVFVGTARAHCLMARYTADVESTAPAAVQRLLTWKKSRQLQDFSSDSMN
ncbi:tetratricopeptide repeat protein 29 isoform X2 [Notolabrus celidotus]|uniref:tetratricopeptide repeat protein 29 isoform X2 n=1 Tax=Notolabrus celidotus TaxID=1203425 RepID=UPI001490117C|nr:tetratricopeptide repeat protein 29 isoform X2 [Notolabrus celidotus]